MNPTDTAKAQAPGALQLAEKVLTAAGYTVIQPTELHPVQFVFRNGRVETFWTTADVRAQLHQDWIDCKARVTFPAHSHDYGAKQPAHATIASLTLGDVYQIT